MALYIENGVSDTLTQRYSIKVPLCQLPTTRNPPMTSDISSSLSSLLEWPESSQDAQPRDNFINDGATETTETPTELLAFQRDELRRYRHRERVGGSSPRRRSASPDHRAKLSERLPPGADSGADPVSNENFRINNQRLLLTYANSTGLRVEDLTSFVESLGGVHRIGRERHANGELHYHVYIDFGKRFQTRSCRRFDIQSGGGVFHPNIAKISRTPGRVWDYVGKEGDIVSATAERPRDSGATGGGRATAEELLACYDERDENSVCTPLNHAQTKANIQTVS